MIDRSLATGASRTTLKQLAEESRRIDLASSMCRRFSTRQDRSRALDEIQSELSPLALWVDRQPTIGYGGSLAYVLFVGDSVDAILRHAVISGSRGGLALRQYSSGVWVTFSSHALARMNQRLLLMDLNVLLELLRPVCELLLGLCYGASLHPRGVKQLSVPFYGGALRCDVDQDSLIVKTFVPEPSTRERQLVNELHDTCCGFPDWLIANMWWAPLGVVYQGRGKKPTRGGMAVRAANNVAERFAAVIEQYSWVEEPYTPRHDPVGEAWNAARLQDERLRR